MLSYAVVGTPHDVSCSCLGYELMLRRTCGGFCGVHVKREWCIAIEHMLALYQIGVVYPCCRARVV